MRCKECGEKLESGARYCDFCGTPVYQKKSIYNTKGDIGHINVDENFYTNTKQNKKNNIDKSKLKKIIILCIGIFVFFAFIIPMVTFKFMSNLDISNDIKNEIMKEIKVNDAISEGSSDNSNYYEAVLFHKGDETYVRVYDSTFFLSDKKLSSVSERNEFEYENLRDYYNTDNTEKFSNDISNQCACLLLTDGQSKTLYIIRESERDIYSIENVERFRFDFNFVHVLKEGNLFLVDIHNDFEKMNYYGGVSSFAYDGDKLFYRREGVIYSTLGDPVNDSVNERYSVAGRFLIYNTADGFKVRGKEESYKGQGILEKTIRIKNDIYIVSSLNGQKNLYHITKNKGQLRLVDEGISKIVFFADAFKEEDQAFKNLFDGLQDRVGYIKDDELYLAIGTFKEKVIDKNSVLISYINDNSFYTYVDGDDVYKYSGDTNYVGVKADFENYFKYADVLGEQLYFLDENAVPMKCDYENLVMRDSKYFLVGKNKIEVYNENGENIDSLPYTKYKFSNSDKLFFINSDDVLFSYQDVKSINTNVKEFDVLNNSVIYLADDKMYINQELIEDEVSDFTVLTKKRNNTYFGLFKGLMREFKNR